MPEARYALYYVPQQDSPLNREAACWLGRNPYDGSRLPPQGLGPLGRDEQERVTGEPRRYGFHGTLKPPFVLSPGREAGDLLTAVEEFARARPAVDLGPMRVTRLGHFLALVAADAPPGLEALASACVRTFDAFRRPPDEAELARRRSRGLTDRQEALLQKWGYPYIMEEFRFHLTLTGGLPAEDLLRLQPLLAHRFDPLCAGGIRLDAVAVFEQPAGVREFRVLERFPLSGMGG